MSMPRLTEHTWRVVDGDLTPGTAVTILETGPSHGRHTYARMSWGVYDGTAELTDFGPDGVLRTYHRLIRGYVGAYAHETFYLSADRQRHTTALPPVHFGTEDLLPLCDPPPAESIGMVFWPEGVTCGDCKEAMGE